jgi:hypothetical protein
MYYVDFSAGNKDYKLRLNTRNVVALERQLGGSLLSIFGTGNTMPTVEAMVMILHASLQQYNHGISLNDAYNIFDNWLAEEHTTVDFVYIILEIYKVSGLVPENINEQAEVSEYEKN